MIAEEIEQAEKKACIQCEALISEKNRFCNYCGASQYISRQLVFASKWMLIKQSALFYGLDLLICFLALFEIFKTLPWLIFFDSFMAATAVGFFVYRWEDTKEILSWKSFSISKLAAYGAIAMSGSLVVHYSVGWLNATIFSKNLYYYSVFSEYDHSKLLMILFTAVFPAIFEELGYRGYLLQNLLKVADKQQAVYISAFLFAVIHLSFISLFWLIPFALFLGFTRVKENTIWYGVFFHFCFNLTACLMELL